MFDEKLKLRKKFTLGADPEIFAFKNGVLVPAFEFLPPKGEGRTMYWDGFQAEWKYKDAWTCQNNLVKNTRESLQQMAKLAQTKGASLSLINVVRIPAELLKTTSYKHVELGCEPSFNAYKLRGKAVENPRLLLYRFTGGHMHFGQWFARPNYVKIVKTLDSILGVWAVGVARTLDSPIRRQYYGLPGEYRMPEYGVNEYGKQTYGVEYRTLSNFWLSMPSLMQVTWDIGRMCVKLAGTKYAKMWVADEQEVIDTISQCDYQQANKIMERNKPMFRWLLGHQRTYDVVARNNAMRISHEGLSEFVDNPHDVPKNWYFKDEWIANAGQDWARWSTAHI